MFLIVYCLIELSFLLSMATKIVESAFSRVKIIKLEFRNKMFTTVFYNSMMCYVDRDIFKFMIDEVTEDFKNMLYLWHCLGLLYVDLQYWFDFRF